jgi:hypothetical protein
MTNEELLARAEKAEKALAYLEAKIAERIDWEKEYWNLLGISAKKFLQLETQIKELKL